MTIRGEEWRFPQNPHRERFDGGEGCVIGGVDFVDVGGFRVEYDNGEIRCVEVVEYTKERTCFVRIDDLQLDRGCVLFP